MLASKNAVLGGASNFGEFTTDSTSVSQAFLQHRRLATARREKKKQRATAPADSASRAPRHPRTLRSTTAAAMPALSKMDLQRAAA